MSQTTADAKHSPWGWPGAKLLDTVEQVFKSYKYARGITPHTHLEQWLAKNNLPQEALKNEAQRLLRAEEKGTTLNYVAQLKDDSLKGDNPETLAATVFIREVFYGLLRREQLLAHIVEGLFARWPEKANRNMTVFYESVLWLLLFALPRGWMTWKEFRWLACELEPTTTFHVLNFAFFASRRYSLTDPTSEKAAGEWLVDQLAVFLDLKHVDSVIDATLKKLEVPARQLLADLAEAAQLVEALKESRSSAERIEVGRAAKQSEPTVAVPFNLSRAKAKEAAMRSSPSLASARELEPPKPVPKSNSTEVMSLEKIQAQKLRRKHDVAQRTKKKYELFEQKGQGKFHLKTEQRPFRLEAIKAEIEENVLAALQPPEKQPPVKTTGTSVSDVKMTQASVMLEDARLRELQRRQAAVIREYETNLLDESDFIEWKRRQELEEEQKAAQAVDDLKKEIEASHMRAKQRAEEVHQLATEEARRMRQQAQQLKEKQHRLQQRELEEKKAAANRLAESLKANTKEAKRQLEDTKAETADAFRQEKAQLLAELKRRREQEMLELRDAVAVRQVENAAAAARAREPRLFDPTESSGLGLLEEMSIYELRERLTQIRQFERENLEQLHQDITQRRSEKAADIARRWKAVLKRREERSRLNDSRRQEKRKKQLKKRQRYQQRLDQHKERAAILEKQKKRQQRLAALQLADSIRRAREVAKQNELNQQNHLERVQRDLALTDKRIAAELAKAQEEERQRHKEARELDISRKEHKQRLQAARDEARRIAHERALREQLEASQFYAAEAAADRALVAKIRKHDQEVLGERARAQQRLNVT